MFFDFSRVRLEHGFDVLEVNQSAVDVVLDSIGRVVLLGHVAAEEIKQHAKEGQA